MANKKGLFGILNDGAGAGVGVDLANPDTTLGSAIDNTMASPAFVNSSGVLVFPALDDEGRLPVTSDSAGLCHSAHAKVVGSTSFQDLASITGTLATLYKNIAWSVSSMTEACFQIVHIDDDGGTPTETVIAEVMTGPGDYTDSAQLDCLDFDTTGGTNVQTFKIQGKLLEATGSEIAGTLAMKEITEA